MPNHLAAAPASSRPGGPRLLDDPGGEAHVSLAEVVGAPDPFDPVAVDVRLGPSDSAREFARKAQFVAYEGMRARYEAWHAVPWRGGGPLPLGLPYPVRPSTAWPAAGEALDAAYYGARKACEPLHVHALPGGSAGWPVRVVNLSTEPLHGGSVTACLYDLGGRPLGEPVTAGVSVAAAGRADVLTVPFGRALPAAHLLRLRLTGPGGRVLSVNDYWRYRTAPDLRSLNGLPWVRLSLSARVTGPAALTATVRNTGVAPAAMVRVCLFEPGTGGEAEVPASVADDNYVWLLPGEARDLTLTWPDPALGVPSVTAEAYNAGRVTT